MHIVNNTDANVIMAWCAILTVLGLVYGWWSRKQDKAIKALEDRLAAEQKSGLRLRGYIWQLLHILDLRKIPYPAPPEELYDTVANQKDVP